MIWEALERGRRSGYLGSMPVGDQVDHSLGFAWVVESRLGRIPDRLLDLGTGGGPPGLILAACWLPSTTVLLESSARRARHLEDALTQLPTAVGARLALGRAEMLGRNGELREAFEVVTARSFAGPAVTAECASPFLEPGGLLVVSEPPGGAGGPEGRGRSEGCRAVDNGGAAGEPNRGPNGAGLAADSARWPAEGMARLGLTSGLSVQVGRFGYRSFQKARPIDDRYPRRTGVPAKRPLF